MWIWIFLSCNYIMMHAASIIQCFCLSQYLWACRSLWAFISLAWWWQLSIRSFWNRYYLFFCFLRIRFFLQLLDHIKWYPGILTLMIFGVSRFCHLCIIFKLIRLIRLWRIVTNMIGFISWQFFCFDLSSIKFSFSI